MDARKAWKRGVTLLELMIVMAIIGILMGLLVPATIKMRKTAAENKVRSARLALRQAIFNFHTEYGLWPAGDQASSNAVFASSTVIEQLRPTGTLNTRHLSFWEGDSLITTLDRKEYYVVINPGGIKPITSAPGSEFESKYTIYFVTR